MLVNHHPSKYGGAAESDSRRRLALQRLRFLTDSLATEGIDRIIAGGDFNDTPDNPVFCLLEPSLLPLHRESFRRGEGTIKYEGKWELIDHVYVSSALMNLPSREEEGRRIGTKGTFVKSDTEDESRPPTLRILRIPFLLTRDTAYTGDKPLRTYLGPRYTGGVSDHLPVLVVVRLPGQNVAAEPP